MIPSTVCAVALAILLPMSVLAVNRIENITDTRTGVVQGLETFHPIIGFDCNHARFTRHSHHITSQEGCIASCSRDSDCQAFSMAEGHCKMFIFNKCSKNVRHCHCSRLARIFVKNQPGLRPGALCPAHFRHSRCGVKYSFISDTSRWDLGHEKCNAEPGLTIMTEPISMDRFNYLLWLYETKYKGPGGVNNFYLGGLQDPGSVEPAGGWHWATCGIPISADMWSPGEPNNSPEKEDVACSWRPEQERLNDCNNDYSYLPWPRTVLGTFCECVSPFD